MNHFSIRNVLPSDASPFLLEGSEIVLRDYEIPGSREFLEAAARDCRVEDRMLRLAAFERSSGRFVGWCCTGIKDELPDTVQQPQTKNQTLSRLLQKEELNLQTATEEDSKNIRSPILRCSL